MNEVDKAKLLDSLKSLIAAIGAILVVFGVMTPEAVLTWTNTIMIGLGAVMTLIATAWPLVSMLRKK